MKEFSVDYFIRLFANSNFSIKTVPAFDGLCLLVFDLVRTALAGTAIFREGYHKFEGM